MILDFFFKISIDLQQEFKQGKILKDTCKSNESLDELKHDVIDISKTGDKFTIKIKDMSFIFW